MHDRNTYVCNHTRDCLAVGISTLTHAPPAPDPAVDGGVDGGVINQVSAVRVQSSPIGGTPVVIAFVLHRDSGLSGDLDCVTVVWLHFVRCSVSSFARCFRMFIFLSEVYTTGNCLQLHFAFKHTTHTHTHAYVPHTQYMPVKIKWNR